MPYNIVRFALYDTELEPIGIMSWPVPDGARVVLIPAMLPIADSIYTNADMPQETFEDKFLVEMVVLRRRTERDGELHGWVGITDRPDLARTHIKNTNERLAYVCK